MTRRVSQDDDRLLLRLLHGETTVGERERLDGRLAAEPALRRRLETLERAWNDLGPPPEAPAPGLADAVRSRLRSEAGSLCWSAAPAWARLGMAAALVAGLGLGFGLGPAPVLDPDLAITEELVDVDPWPVASDSLAEQFWLALEATEGELPEGPEEGPVERVATEELEDPT